MSILSSVQFFTISSAASAGMIPSRAWTRASAASMSRYFCVLFSSEKTLRIAAVEKILPKIAESMIVEGISLAPMERRAKSFSPRQQTAIAGETKRRATPCSVRRALENALRLQHHRTVDHLAVDLRRAASAGGRDQNPSRPGDLILGRHERSMDS